MEKDSTPRAGNWLLAIPSFWGLVAWTVACSAYLFGNIGWYPPTAYGLVVMIGMAFAYLVSLAVFTPQFQAHFNRRYDPSRVRISRRWTVVFHLLGIGFCLLYVFDVEQTGRLSAPFFVAFISDPLSIRSVQLAELSRGMQLSYVGWLAVFLSGASLAVSRSGAKTHIVLTTLQLAANLVFMSKMRPFAVILLFTLPYLILNRHRFSFSKIAAMAALLMAGLVVAFIAWTGATGKTFQTGQGYPPVLETFLLYLTSGPAYLSHIITVEVPDYIPARTFRPFFTASALLFDTSPPPSAINVFYSIPISTNVGTALEPWYRDMGLVGIALGVLVLSFGLDAMAYWGIKFGRVSGYLLTAIMCYCSIFAFFAPRLTTGAVVAVLAIFLIHWVLIVFSKAARSYVALTAPPQTPDGQINHRNIGL